MYFIYLRQFVDSIGDSLDVYKPCIPFIIKSLKPYLWRHKEEPKNLKEVRISTNSTMV